MKRITVRLFTLTDRGLVQGPPHPPPLSPLHYLLLRCEGDAPPLGPDAHVAAGIVPRGGGGEGGLEGHSGPVILRRGGGVTSMGSNDCCYITIVSNLQT